MYLYSIHPVFHHPCRSSSNLHHDLFYGGAEQVQHTCAYGLLYGDSIYQHHTSVHKYIDTVPVHPIPPASAPFIGINTVHIYRSTTILVLFCTAHGKGSMLFPQFDVSDKTLSLLNETGIILP